MGVGATPCPTMRDTAPAPAIARPQTGLGPRELADEQSVPTQPMAGWAPPNLKLVEIAAKIRPLKIRAPPPILRPFLTIALRWYRPRRSSRPTIRKKASSSIGW